MLENKIENKIEKLIEESLSGFRNRNLAAMRRDLSPEQLEALQGTGKKLQVAGKQAIPNTLAGVLGGGLGAGIATDFDDPELMAAAAGVMGGAVGLGSGVGGYLNAQSTADMSKADARKHSRDFRTNFGKNLADGMAAEGKVMYK